MSTAMPVPFLKSFGALEQHIQHHLLAAYIYGILKLARSRKVLVSYVDLAHAFGIFSGGYDLARALGLVMEHCQGTPDDLLPAIVSKREGMTPVGPGEGFFEKAVSLGYTCHGNFWTDALTALGYDLNNLAFISVGMPRTSSLPSKQKIDQMTTKARTVLATAETNQTVVSPSEVAAAKFLFGLAQGKF